jgi:hypothetical protein
VPLPDAPDARVPDSDWRHPWLRINILLRDMAHVVSHDRSTRPILKPELNKAIAMRAKMMRHVWWN